MDIRKLLNQSFKTEFEKNDEIILCNNRKEKRFRSAFTTDQIKYLEMQFKSSRYIGIVSRKEIAKALNISERAIKIWFQNRRMKEKNYNNKEYNHNDLNVSPKATFDQQPRNLEVFQSNNDPCIHSSPAQSKPPTSSNDNFVKNNHKIVANEVTTNRVTEKDSDDIVTSPYFEKKNISNTTGQFSVELLKKYKNRLHNESIRKSPITNLNIQARRKEGDKCMPKETTKVRKEICQSSVPVESSTASAQHQHRSTCTQMRTGYVPLYPQKRYQSTSCLPAGNILWKPVDRSEMADFMPMRDFALMPHPQTAPYPIPQKHNVQRCKCYCNCHMMHLPQATAAFTQENQIPQPQYIMAVPIHKHPIHFSPTVYKHC